MPSDFKAKIYVGALRLRAQKISNPGKCSFLQGWQTICSVSLRAPWAMFVIFKYNGMSAQRDLYVNIHTTKSGDINQC